MPQQQTVRAPMSPTWWSEAASLLDLLDHWADVRPDDRAYVSLTAQADAEQSLSFITLRQRVRQLAGYLAARASAGDRALLVFPGGLEFVVSFFACLASGVVPVPVMPPRRNASRDATLAIVVDCAPRLALVATNSIEDGASGLASRCDPAVVSVVPISLPFIEALPEQPFPLRPDPQDLAFLQYTSGSTELPKGVMVSHGNLLANLAMLREAFGNGPESIHVSWLPLYHDMGLILNVLQTLYLGTLCVLMTPASFLHRPLNWIRAISTYRGVVAAAPNFAYDLCVDRLRPEQVGALDLSCWKVASNGAEPVRAATLQRFAEAFAPYGFDPKALYPAYGMAETTLFISAGRRGDGAFLRPASQTAMRLGRIEEPEGPTDMTMLVGCGRPTLDGSVAIVDPSTRRRVDKATIGEIWISGPHVAQGYWGRPAQTVETFGATIAREDRGRWLRSGDLGCILPEGPICVVGRLKDVIIIRGANFHPTDIEATVATSHPALRRDCGAAFGVVDASEERLVVVHEIDRGFRRWSASREIVAAIRDAVAVNHGIMAHRVVLVQPGSLHKTTSGKIQRARAREQWISGTLAIWTNETADGPANPAAGTASQEGDSDEPEARFLV